jgi:hypothetical protein
MQFAVKNTERPHFFFVISQRCSNGEDGGIRSDQDTAVAAMSDPTSVNPCFECQQIRRFQRWFRSLLNVTVDAAGRTTGDSHVDDSRNCNTSEALQRKPISPRWGNVH